MDAQELQRLQYEQQKAINDMLVYGTGFTVGGKHVPTETVMMFSNPEVTSTTPAAPVAERAVSPAESVLPPLPKPSGDWEGVDGWDEDAMRDYALAAHAEGRRSAMEELVELKREKERRDRIVQRAIARLNAAEVEEPSVIGAGFADPALPIEELHPQWLKEKERADRAEAAIAAAREESYAAGRRNGARDERISSKAEAEEAAALAARQAPDADDLVRYTPAIDQAHGIAYALKSPKGSFVLFADVQALLAQPLQQEGGKDELQALLTRIDDAFEAYERFGGICEFEGQPMIYADTLTEIITLRGEYHVATLAAPPASDNLQQASTAQVEPAPNNAEVAPNTPAWTIGNCMTVSQNEYPGMGAWFKQVWQGDDLVARVYGNSFDEVHARAARIVGTVDAAQATPEGGQDERAAFEAARSEFWQRWARLWSGGAEIGQMPPKFQEAFAAGWQARAALAANPQAVEPVYQVASKAQAGAWHDTTKEAFDIYVKEGRYKTRILYRAAPPQQVATIYQRRIMIGPNTWEDVSKEIFDDAVRKGEETRIHTIVK